MQNIGVLWVCSSKIRKVAHQYQSEYDKTTANLDDLTNKTSH